MHKLPFPKSFFTASSPFKLIHSDLWGPVLTSSINGFKYYVLFIDHFTKFTWIYLLNSKSEVFTKFVQFKAIVETQFSIKIKTFSSDGGGEYTSNAFKTYLSQQGIVHQVSCPYTPQQNGLVERTHRHLIETTITLLSQASMPPSYWSYAVLTAVLLINLLPTSVFAFHSPWHKLYSVSPDLSQLKVFGCACYPHLRPYTPHKLAPRSTECIFLGYPMGTKGYLCLDSTTKHLYTSRHVIFNESRFLYSLLTNSFPPNSSPPFSSDLSWFSNLLYLHFTN